MRECTLIGAFFFGKVKKKRTNLMEAVFLSGDDGVLPNLQVSLEVVHKQPSGRDGNHEKQERHSKLVQRQRRHNSSNHSIIKRKWRNGGPVDRSLCRVYVWWWWWYKSSESEGEACERQREREKEGRKKRATKKLIK